VMGELIWEYIIASSFVYKKKVKSLHYPSCINERAILNEFSTIDN
jgi:hypothetical protein